MKRFNRLIFALVTFAVAAISAADTAAPTGDTQPSAPPVPQVSAAEMKVQSTVLQQQVESDLQNVERLRELTKKQKDVIKLTCVNDRLLQAKAQTNMAEDAKNRLDVALDKDINEARSQFATMSQTAATVKQLREQAEACVGEPDLMKQESGVSVEHPELPDDPVQDGTMFEEPEVEAPGYASPYH